MTNLFSKKILYYERGFNQSFISLFHLPYMYIKDADVNLVNKLFNISTENRKAIFELLKETLSDLRHPLNAGFLSEILISLKMNQRDISWTEYLREDRFEFKSFVEEFESQCKSPGVESQILIQKQHLVSKFILWFLTSTNRYLRDISTRALYFYGRKYPLEFSKLVYDSLKINDPYVWERSLASLYGVTMAEHNSFNNDTFRNDILPKLGKTLNKLMFAKDAPHSTTHILARDYARRIIEICLMHYPDSFKTEDIKNIRPPYLFGGIREWGEYDYGDKDHDYGGPIRMDFSNYTIGRIVKDGESYSNPPEKIKVRKQIYWRIYDLGWNESLFKQAETALGNDNYYRSRTERADSERYGKKYSWIAYYENSGLRNDLGLIEREWDRFRISDSDIDPSFPEKPENQLFFKYDLLGDRSTSLSSWYENGGMPYIEEYLTQKDLKRRTGDWICLDGFINQEDTPSERSRFTFIRSFLVKENDCPEISKLLKEQKLGNRWLPEKRENYYTFAGELYLFKDATFDNSTELEFEISKKKVIIKRGEPGYLPSVFWEMGNNKINIKEDFPDEIEREISDFKSFSVILPVMEYNWEGYHNDINQAGHTTVLSKEIVNYLGLIDQPQTFDLYDKGGNKASLSVYYYNDYNNTHTFVYLRKDLLEKFLHENNLKLIWAIWGEREVSFQTEQRRTEFFKENPFKDYQLFQKIIEF
jgi:hypothetical protein